MSHLISIFAFHGSDSKIFLYTCKVSRSEISSDYHKVPKFTYTRKLCCNSPKIQTKRQNLKVFCQKHANGIPNSEDPDQTSLLGAV